VIIKRVHKRTNAVWETATKGFPDFFMRLFTTTPSYCFIPIKQGLSRFTRKEPVQNQFPFPCFSFIILYLLFLISLLTRLCPTGNSLLSLSKHGICMSTVVPVFSGAKIWNLEFGIWNFSLATCFPHINMFYKLLHLPSRGGPVPLCREVRGGLYRKSTNPGIGSVIPNAERNLCEYGQISLPMYIGIEMTQCTPALCQSRCTSGTTALLRAGNTKRIEPVKLNL
jgi:hypothetical protein